jgi:hypothetical protein
MTTPARKPNSQVLAYIGREIDWTDAGFTTPWLFGCIPGGSTPNAVSVLITDGFTWTLSNTGYQVQIGTAADLTRWGVQGFSGAAPARVDSAVNADKARPMSKDSEAFIQIVPDAPLARPTKGHAIVWLSFLPHPLTRDAFAPWG